MASDTDLSRPKPAYATRGAKPPTPRVAAGTRGESEQSEDAQRPTTERRSGETRVPAGTAGVAQGAYAPRRCVSTEG